MAKVIDSPSGTLNGKIGGLVYYQIDGKTYVRKAPPKQTKSQKKKVSRLKKLSQDKMAMTQRYLKPLTKVIAFGYQEFANGARRPYHACVSYTKSHCFVHDVEGFYIDSALVKMSRGSLFPPDEAKAEITGDGIKITWSDNSWRSSARPFDQMFLILYNPESQRVEWEFLGSFRKSCQHFFSLKPSQLDVQWNIYLAFSQENTRTKKRILSDSVYLGKF